MAKTGVIYGINGPVVSLAGDPGFHWAYLRENNDPGV